MKKAAKKRRRKARSGVTNHRTMKWLRDRGYSVDVTERWIGGGKFKKRRDLYGIIDLVALKPGKVGVLGIQTTGASGDLHRRIRKAMGRGDDQTPEERRQTKANVKLWLACGNRLWFVGWRKLKRNGRDVYAARVFRLRLRGGRLVPTEIDP